MEQSRHDNCAQIVNQCYSIASHTRYFTYTTDLYARGGRLIYSNISKVALLIKKRTQNPDVVPMILSV
jgi:hypothetical protein